MEHSCYSRDECIFEFKLGAKRPISNAVVGFAIWNSEGVLMFAASSLDCCGKYLDLQEGTYALTFMVRLPVKADTYQVEVNLNEGNAKQVDRWFAEPQLVVLPRFETSLPPEWHGLVNEDAKFELTIEESRK
jgi:hypothetical protein